MFFSDIIEYEWWNSCILKFCMYLLKFPTRKISALNLFNFHKLDFEKIPDDIEKPQGSTQIQQDLRHLTWNRPWNTLVLGLKFVQNFCTWGYIRICLAHLLSTISQILISTGCIYISCVNTSNWICSIIWKCIREIFLENASGDWLTRSKKMR